MKISIVTGLSLCAASAAFAPPKSMVSIRNVLRMTSPNNGKDGGVEMPNISMPDVSKVADSFGKYDVGTVLGNIAPSDGEALGSRGELYFFVQAVLVMCVLIGGVPIVGDVLQALLGPVFLLGGAALALLSLADLGSDALSPFPKPPKTATLKTTGIYAEMRHPMYTGLLTTLFGLSLGTNSADRLLLTGALLYLCEIKTEKEEEFLTQQFPSEYPAYQAMVTEKFLPVTLSKKLPWCKE